MSFMQKCFEANLGKLKGKEPKESFHKFYLSYALFFERQKKYPEALNLMKLAVKCSKLGKDARLILRYEILLENIGKKSRG